MVLEFLCQTEWVWIVFKGMSYPKAVKSLTCPKLVKKRLVSISTSPKTAK